MYINGTHKFLKLCSYIIATCFFSCNRYENITKTDLGIDYFPLKINTEIIYNVDSTVYDDFNNRITKYQFLLKDIVTTKFIDAQGNDSYKIERYKQIGNEPWFFQKIISKNINHNRAEEFIDNRRYVRLVFPLTENSKWNGNLFNDIGSWEYKVTSLNQPLNINGKNIDSTLQINQYEEVNLIREDVYKETYAKHIGLVYKEITAIDKDLTTGKTKRGFILKMQLNSYK